MIRLKIFRPRDRTVCDLCHDQVRQPLLNQGQDQAFCLYFVQFLKQAERAERGAKYHRFYRKKIPVFCRHSGCNTDCA